MSSDLDIPFDRITYRAGQLLTARDLSDDRRRDDRLRRLHVRHLHETWGIALGLEVEQVDNRTAVAVGPGYAVDEKGRDLLLAESVRLAVPNVSRRERLVLTMCYQADAAFRDRHNLVGLCLDSGLDPRHERPLFIWRRPEEVHFGPEVPLVQIVTDSGVIRALDLRVRRNAQALVHPHIGWGTTKPGRSGWQSWEAGDYQGLEIVVDTSPAGFTREPYYFALLHGDFGIHDLDTVVAGRKSGRFLDPYGFIASATRQRFTYQVLQSSQMPLPPEEAEYRKWTVSWLGIEPVTGCEPVFWLDPDIFR
jgi:hypothetical protein